MLFVSPFMAMADDIGDGNGTGDVDDNAIPVAPIDDYAPLLVLGALVVGYTVTNKKRTTINK